jgi:hypothetical protein
MQNRINALKKLAIMRSERFKCASDPLQDLAVSIKEAKKSVEKSRASIRVRSDNNCSY